MFSKCEVILFMIDFVVEYNVLQSDVKVEIDMFGVDVVLVSFVCGNLLDIMFVNYNYEIVWFVQCCVFIDFLDIDVVVIICDDLQLFMDQYGFCEGCISVLFYLVMVVFVIYNKEIFEVQGFDVLQIWDEFIVVCDELKVVGIDLFYGIFKDDWIVGQGWYDYIVGGFVDVIDFFDVLVEEGEMVGFDFLVLFQKDFVELMDWMMQFVNDYMNVDVLSCGYGDGNFVFVKGEVVMYLQGLWVFSEIVKILFDLQLGMFLLFMIDDLVDFGVWVNMDFVVMIFEELYYQEVVCDFFEFLYELQNIEEYNVLQFGFIFMMDVLVLDDLCIEGMIEYYDVGQIYQGFFVFVFWMFLIFNYVQVMVFGVLIDLILCIMDVDWVWIVFWVLILLMQDNVFGEEVVL